MRIVSALNKIIQYSYFKEKYSLEEQKAQKEDRILRERQIACMIYDNFRITDAHDTVLDYADLFTIILRNDVQSEIRYEMGWNFYYEIVKIPSDDVQTSFYKLRIRESDQLKTVLELYDMEFCQKISMPDYQKMKTIEKRSIDQKLRLRNFDVRNERMKTDSVMTNRREVKKLMKEVKESKKDNIRKDM